MTWVFFKNERRQNPKQSPEHDTRVEVLTAVLPRLKSPEMLCHADC